MIEIEGKIVSADLLREKFACDLSQCKGACCIEGDAGAPLEIEEVDILEEEYENYKPYMTPEGIKAVEEQGFMVVAHWLVYLFQQILHILRKWLLPNVTI